MPDVEDSYEERESRQEIIQANPYLNRSMIRDPKQFFGRKRELARIYSRIGAVPPQCVSVVGERRIGKSSLLNSLMWKQHQDQYLESGDTPLFVFLDFQQFRGIRLDEFFSLLFSQVENLLPEWSRNSENNGYATFQQMLEQLRDSKKKLVFLFDEFDAITSNPAFNSDFFAFLRSAANNFQLAYVTSSHEELQQICHSSDIADSPFFNIFANIYLRSFTPQEAVDLICGPSAEAGYSLKPFLEPILRLSGRFPFFIQIACSTYFEALTEADGRAPDPESLRLLFQEEADPHFRYLWSHCTPEEKNVIREMMAGHAPGPEARHICESLERSGLLLRENKQFRIFSPAFVDCVRVIDSSPRPDQRLELATPVDRFLSILPGEWIHQYQIQQKVGEGGMGMIYQAYDDTLRRTVALKFLRPSLIPSEEASERLIREARAAASLNHSSINAVYELFEHGDRLTLVMEWVDGQTLEQLVADQGRLDWRQLTQWMIQICDGLEAAHYQGIIHRDIKASNLMISRENRAKILDFGLAKKVDLKALGSERLTASGSVLGTVSYMSPEQANGKDLDCRSDLFSLGIVLFECLTGRLPFQGSSFPEILHAIAYDTPPHLGLYGTEASEKLDPIVRKLLEKPLKNRYQRAGDLKRDLESLLEKRGRFASWLSSLKGLDAWS